MPRKIVPLLIAGVVVLAAAGCTKKVRLTIANHSEHSRSLQLTVPDETLTIGAVSAGGRLTHTLKVKTDDLPAQCSLSAGAGSRQSFTVTEDSPGRWWFHITKDGQVAGPYAKDDVHTETEERGEVEVRVRTETVVE